MQELTGRLFCSGMFAAAFAFLVFDRNHPSPSDRGLKYPPYISGTILPTIIITLLIVELLFNGPKQAVQMMFSFSFGLFAHISLYFLILLLLLPLLRQYLCARTCALLWMLPNYLYITQYNSMELPAPKLVLTVPGNWGQILCIIWFLGMVVILAWKIAEHQLFRREILKGSVPVSEPVSLAIWQSVLDEARIPNPSFKLVTSPKVRSPLSIGLWNSKTVVVLPCQNYTPDELELIFRHEIIHISRGDAWSKFFLIFCTAICWFNPLMWFSMKKSFEDLELSCDESVLLNADSDTHKRYALLLLDHAGDSRGFTTCLAASLQAMRYRLKRITQPTVQRSGALFVGIIFFVLCMSCGYISLAYDETSGKEIFSPYGTAEQYLFSPRDQNISAEPLIHALSDLSYYEMTGTYSFSGFEKLGYCVLDTPDGIMFLHLYDHAIEFSVHTREGRASAQYYIPDGINPEISDLLK